MKNKLSEEVDKFGIPLYEDTASSLWNEFVKLDKAGFFKKWFKQSESEDYFESTVLGDEDFNEKAKERFAELEDISIDDVDDNSKEFKMFLQDERESTAQDWYDDRWNELNNDMYEKLKSGKNGIKIYRAVSVEDPDEFIFHSAFDTYINNHNGVGVYWAWDESSAEAHWGHGKGKEIVIHAEAALSSIDIPTTLMLNMDFSLGRDEAEIRLKEKAKVYVSGFDVDGEFISVDNDKFQLTAAFDKFGMPLVEGNSILKPIDADIADAWEVLKTHLQDEDNKYAWNKEFKPKFDQAVKKAKILKIPTKKAAKEFNSYRHGRKVKDEALYNPIIVADIGTDNPIVLDGNHRLEALYKKGEKFINVLMLKIPWASDLDAMESEPLAEGAAGDWKKEGYTFRDSEYELSSDHWVNSVEALFNGKVVGHIAYSETNDGKFYSRDTEVKPEHRRKGLATAMAKYLENKLGKKMKPSGMQSPDAKKLWSQPNRPFGEDEDDDVQNGFIEDIRLPEFFFGREGINDFQHSYKGSDKGIFDIGQHRSGHPYTFLPHRIKFYVERNGLPDFIHVISNRKSNALKAVYAEKGKDMIQLWSFVNIRQEPGWKAFEKAAHDAGYKIKDFSKGEIEDSHGYWLDESDDDLYLAWLKERDQIEAAVNAAQIELRKITGDNKGALTPDSIKATDEYKKAKNNFNRAFKMLRDFNGKSPKEFMRRSRKFKVEEMGSLMLPERLPNYRTLQGYPQKKKRMESSDPALVHLSKHMEEFMKNVVQLKHEKVDRISVIDKYYFPKSKSVAADIEVKYKDGDEHVYHIDYNGIHFSWMDFGVNVDIGSDVEEAMVGFKAMLDEKVPHQELVKK